MSESISPIPTAVTYLFVPANRPERYSKALASGSDAVIVDLEDAVPPDEKTVARQQLSEWLKTAEQKILIRVNGPETPWHQEDVQLSLSPNVAGIVLPKTQYVEELAGLASMMPDKPILPILETAIGFANAAALSKQTGVQRLVFGTIDFQIDMGIDGNEDELLYFRSKLVLISRLAFLEPPVDGVSTHIADLDRLREDTHRARKIGFGGKLCIHPSQIAAVNGCFTPDPEQIAWAERVVAGMQRSAGNPFTIDGKMVDLPFVIQAEGILRASRRG